MSHESVQVVRSIYTLGEGTSARGYMHAEIEHVNPPDAVETGTRQGADSFARIRDVYDEVRIEPRE